MCLHRGALCEIVESALTFIETRNYFELFPIGLNWPVKSWVYSEMKSNHVGVLGRDPGVRQSSEFVGNSVFNDS